MAPKPFCARVGELGVVLCVTVVVCFLRGMILRRSFLDTVEDAAGIIFSSNRTMVIYAF